MVEHKELYALVLMVVIAAATGCVAVVPPPRGAGHDKLVVCHKGKTLEVAAAAADAHFRHGDTRGPCR